MRVNEVAEELGVSVPYAYKLIRELNEELRKTGCITIAGRIFFTDADDMIEVCTHNTPLKNRLAAFAEEYPSECRLIDDDENGCQTYEIRKGRFGFKLTPPYSQERKRAASRLAKNNIENLRRTTKSSFYPVCSTWTPPVWS